MSRFTLLSFLLMACTNFVHAQASECTSYGGAEFVVEIYPAQQRGELIAPRVNITVWKLDGTLIYPHPNYPEHTGYAESRNNCDWRWSNDTGTGNHDFDCVIGPTDPLCDVDAYVIQIGGKRYFYAPNVGTAPPPIGSFYWPRPRVDNVDMGVGYYRFAGVSKAKPGLPNESYTNYYEDVFSGGPYVIPYNEEYYFSQTVGFLPQPLFFSPLTHDCTVTVLENENIDPFDLTISFAEEDDGDLLSSWPDVTWDLPDVELRFSAGVGLDVQNYLSVEDVIFTEKIVFGASCTETGTGWDGILVNASGEIHFDGVIVEHADVGIEIRSTGNVIRNTLFDQNGVGILADFLQTNGFIPGLSWFHLRESCVTNSVFDDVAGLEGYGIWGRYTNALIVNSTVEDNDAYGVFFDRADLIIAHGLLVTGNGQDASAPDRDGVRSGPFADITLASPMGGSGIDVGPERNSIHDNAENQISVDVNGFATVGVACGTNCTGNSVYGTFGNPSPKLIFNEPVGVEIPAEEVFWNTTPADPPDLAFFRPSDVNDKGALASDPASDAGRSAGCERETFLPGGSSSARGSSSSFLAHIGEQSRGMDAQTRAELIERIQSMRQALIRNPAADTAEALLGRLYGLQRLDREDELGEHAATMGALTSIRAHLLGGQQLPTTLRATAEAALVASVHDLMRREQYEQVEQTVWLFSSQVEHENTMVALAITDVSLTELDGDYASAIAKYHAIIESLGPDREQLAGDLEATIALLQRRLGEENGREGTPGLGLVAADAPAEAEVSQIAGFRLEAAYPNPFNPSTVIPFTVDAPSIVSIAVYDILGRQVALLADGRVEAGRHEAIFDGTELPSGAYLVRATMQPENGEAVRTYMQRITLLK